MDHGISARDGKNVLPPSPSRPSNRFVAVDEVVAQLTAGFRERPQTKAHFLRETWRQAVGEQIAGHTEPQRLLNGLLTIRVDASVWVTQLLHIKPIILAALAKASPGSDIRDIRLVQGTLRHRPTPSSAPAPREKLPPPLPEESEKAARMVANVSDAELRSALGQLYQTLLIRRRCG
ncbi:MAG: DUF721 domain-containing protein [Magnetococcales bacterium]|nr:DUF721 domain-containing protein [Magnetococcales bacterium]